MASLGRDLATIREEKDLSLDDIHKATKIPPHILESIEDDTIFTDFDENPTYIRSYVRSYAKALSIDEQQVIYALDRTQRGNYQGSLVQRSDASDDRIVEPADPEETEDTITENEREQDVPEQEPVSSPAADLPPSEPEKEPPTPKPTAESPGVRSIDWANMGRRFQPLDSAQSKVWIAVISILLITVVGGYLYFYQFSGNGSGGGEANPQNQQATTANLPSDSLQLNVIPPADEDTLSPQAETEVNQMRSQSLEALPDTLSMILYAAYGKLEPVRVYTDIMDSINPYWIEEGEAVRFNFVNEIRIRGQYSRMVLMLNGHVVQNFREEFYNPDTRLLEIRRSYFEDDPKWLQPAPDSLEIDAPPPTTISNRPTFN